MATVNNGTVDLLGELERFSQNDDSRKVQTGLILDLFYNYLHLTEINLRSFSTTEENIQELVQQLKLAVVEKAEESEDSEESPEVVFETVIAVLKSCGLSLTEQQQTEPDSVTPVPASSLGQKKLDNQCTDRWRMYSADVKAAQKFDSLAAVQRFEAGKGKEPLMKILAAGPNHYNGGLQEEADNLLQDLNNEQDVEEPDEFDEFSRFKVVPVPVQTMRQLVKAYLSVETVEQLHVPETQETLIKHGIYEMTEEDIPEGRAFLSIAHICPDGKFVFPKSLLGTQYRNFKNSVESTEQFVLVQLTDYTGKSAATVRDTLFLDKQNLNNHKLVNKLSRNSIGSTFVLPAKTLVSIKVSDIWPDDEDEDDDEETFVEEVQRRPESEGSPKQSAAEQEESDETEQMELSPGTTQTPPVANMEQPALTPILAQRILMKDSEFGQMVYVSAENWNTTDDDKPENGWILWSTFDRDISEQPDMELFLITGDCQIVGISQQHFCSFFLQWEESVFELSLKLDSRLTESLNPETVQRTLEFAMKCLKHWSIPMNVFFLQNQGDHTRPEFPLVRIFYSLPIKKTDLADLICCLLAREMMIVDFSDYLQILTMGGYSQKIGETCEKLKPATARQYRRNLKKYGILVADKAHSSFLSEMTVWFLFCHGYVTMDAERLFVSPAAKRGTGDSLAAVMERGSQWGQRTANSDYRENVLGFKKVGFPTLK